MVIKIPEKVYFTKVFPQSLSGIFFNTSTLLVDNGQF